MVSSHWENQACINIQGESIFPRTIPLSFICADSFSRTTYTPHQESLLPGKLGSSAPPVADKNICSLGGGFATAARQWRVEHLWGGEGGINPEFKCYCLIALPHQEKGSSNSLIVWIAHPTPHSMVNMRMKMRHHGFCCSRADLQVPARQSAQMRLESRVHL